MTELNTIKVVAFDPGVTTGFALGEITEGLMKVRTGQAQWDVLDMWRQLHWYKPNHIICENFEYRNRAREGLVLFSVQLIGVIELYSRMSGLNQTPKANLYLQKPGTVINGHFDNTKLKTDKLYRPGNIHSNEACMHLLYWYTFGPGYKHNQRGYEAA